MHSQFQLFLEEMNKGELKSVNEYLQNKAVQENVVANNNEALRLAAGYGHLPVVERLLKEKAVQENVIANNNEALQSAAAYGHLAIVERLLKEKAVQENIGADDGAWRRGIWNIMQCDLLLIVQRLLKEKAMQENIAANNNEASQSIVGECHLAVAYRLIEIYKLKNLPITQNIDIRRTSEETKEGMEISLSKFFEQYQNSLKKVRDDIIDLAGSENIRLGKDLALLIFSYARNELPMIPLTTLLQESCAPQNASSTNG